MGCGCLPLHLGSTAATCEGSNSAARQPSGVAGKRDKALREAPFTWIVLAAHELPFPHQDPADRFLAATAGTLGLTLVTADDRLLGLGKIATLANH